MITADHFNQRVSTTCPLCRADISAGVGLDAPAGWRIAVGQLVAQLLGHMELAHRVGGQSLAYWLRGQLAGIHVVNTQFAPASWHHQPHIAADELLDH